VKDSLPLRRLPGDRARSTAAGLFDDLSNFQMENLVRITLSIEIRNVVELLLEIAT
jgi:hypothetical protein